MVSEPTPLTLAQEAARSSLAAAAAAQRVADLAEARDADVIRRLDKVIATQEAQGVMQAAQGIALVETRADLRRIEAVAVTTAAQATLTNGHVTALRLWRSEVGGIAQGAGGTGRLLLYMLGAASTAAGLIVMALNVLGR